MFNIEANILVLLFIFMLIAEKRILKDKYILFSPYTIGQFSFLYVYIMPFFFYSNRFLFNMLNHLDSSAVKTSLLYFTIFYLLFCLLSLQSFYKIRNRVSERVKLDIRIGSDFILISMFFFIAMVFLGEMIIVKFSFSTFIDKMINPRKYTYLREGLGVFNLTISFSKSLLLFLSIIYYKQKKDIISTSIFVISLLLNILGGSKSSMLVVLIYWILLSQKLFHGYLNIKFSKLILYGFFLIIVASISFMLMRTNEDRATFKGAISGIVEYSQEAFYTTKVISDFEWKVDHLSTVIEGIIFTPIPRFMYDSKGYYGLNNKFWRPKYQSDRGIFHTSTYGFLAEGYMLFSFYSIIIYAFFFNLLFRKMYITFFDTNTLTKLYFIVLLSQWIYFLVRTGLFMPTTTWILFLFYLGAKIFFRRMEL